MSGAAQSQNNTQRASSKARSPKRWPQAGVCDETRVPILESWKLRHRAVACRARETSVGFQAPGECPVFCDGVEPRCLPAGELERCLIITLHGLLS